MKYLKIFEEFTQQTANLQKVKITSSDSHGEIIMIGHILKKEDNFKDDQYFFIPEEDGFKSIEKEHMPYIDSLRKKFNDSIGKKLLIDAGDYQSIKFGSTTHNTDVSIGDLIFHEEGVTFEYI